jgi:uncharacterized protein YbbC (DUF1343 family)
MKILLTLGFLSILCASPGDSKFRLGNEVLLEKEVNSLKNKNVALIINQTSILSDGTFFLDALLEKGVNVVKIFSPEHGIRGDETYSEVDSKTGIPIVSLYGGKTKPTAADLKDINVLIYDIQDVGARFYTYTSTLYYIIEAAAENSKQLIVCDRPIVMNPQYVDGFILDKSFESFVGKIPTPVCYGMTPGELANLLSSKSVKVAEMDFYSRLTNYDSLNLKWVKPSPNIFTPYSALCYPATCFLEGTNASEGRGTSNPFEYAGAPWCNSEKLAGELNAYGLAGVIFEPANFTPSEKVSAYPPKFFNTECSGVHIRVTDKDKFESVKAGVTVLVALKKLFPEFKLNKDNFIDKLAGTDRLRKMINNGSSYNEIIDSWQSELDTFKELRKQYLLYP